MTELDTIKKLAHPITKDSLVADFKNLGIKKGDILTVHSSLSSIGWVSGGAIAVILALFEVLGENGTLIMPAHSGDLSDPSGWGNPPVPESWWQTIRDTMPGYHPKYTPTRSMGAIAEAFRSFPEVSRSSHPQVSFSGWGQHAADILANHSLNYGLGECSPLGKLYQFSDAKILLLGVNYENNTSFHLAEYRQSDVKPIKYGAPILENDKTIWTEYTDIELFTDNFLTIGTDFEAENKCINGTVGNSKVKLFNQKKAVDFAESWLKNHSQK